MSVFTVFFESAFGEVVHPPPDVCGNLFNGGVVSECSACAKVARGVFLQGGSLFRLAFV